MQMSKKQIRKQDQERARIGEQAAIDSRMGGKKWEQQERRHAFEKFKNEEEALEFAAKRLSGNEYPIIFIQKYMKVRGFYRDLQFWEQQKQSWKKE